MQALAHMTRQIAIVGCGNPVRRDDGVGPAVIRALKNTLSDPRVALLDAGTDGIAVMFAARGCTSLIVVDAVTGGGEPGAIFEVPGQKLERAYAPSVTLHDFRWNDALFAGRKMYGEVFPEDVVVLLVEASELGLGVELTAPVLAAIPLVARRIEELVAERLPAAVPP